MQRTLDTVEQLLGGLIDELRVNRAALSDGRSRLSALLTTTREQLAAGHSMRAEAQRSLERLRRSRREATAPPAGPGAPPLPRYLAGAPDPLDTARQQLHEAFAARREPAVRAELLSSYDGFARSLALKFRHREDVDDLMQVARIGLLHAIDRFDPALGRPFPLFARITITGELKRHIRDRTWGMRVPRSLQEDYLNVMRAVDELTGEQSDSPSMEAVAERCGMSVERVVEAMELRVSQRPLSIDAPAGTDADESPVEIGREDDGFGRLENRDLLTHLLGRLPERDRRIIELRFGAELTQSEIAAEMGVSRMCVSRVLARTLGRLRLWARTAAG